MDEAQQEQFRQICALIDTIKNGRDFYRVMNRINGGGYSVDVINAAREFKKCFNSAQYELDAPSAGTLVAVAADIMERDAAADVERGNDQRNSCKERKNNMKLFKRNRFLAVLVAFVMCVSLAAPAPALERPTTGSHTGSDSTSTEIPETGKPTRPDRPGDHTGGDGTSTDIPENPDPENPDPENPDPENPDPVDPTPSSPPSGGGSTGGGTTGGTPTTSPTTTIPDDDVPLAGGPEDVTEIEDEDVPLADLPEELTTIEDDDVPLADVPKTGDDSLIWEVFTMMFGAGLAWLFLDEKRKAVK